MRSATNLFVQLVRPQTIQVLPGANERRLSELQECFLLTNPGGYWEQLGYVVLPYRNLDVQQPLGTLYRIALSNHVSQFTSNSLSGLYLTNRATLFRWGTNAVFQRVTDGVVHFRVRLLDGTGIRYSLTNGVSTNIFMDFDPLATVEPELRYAFLEGALPEAVEVELGILDPQVVADTRPLRSHSASRHSATREKLPTRRATSRSSCRSRRADRPTSSRGASRKA